jgi:hypothetical protein
MEDSGIALRHPVRDLEESAAGKTEAVGLSLSYRTHPTQPRRKVTAFARLWESGEGFILEFKTADLWRQEEPVDEGLVLRELEQNARSCLGSR